MNLFDRHNEAHGLGSSLKARTAAGPAAWAPGPRLDGLEGLADALRTWHRDARARHERRRHYRRTVAELSALDDHVLADIGVRREDIPAVAAGAARQVAR